MLERQSEGKRRKVGEQVRERARAQVEGLNCGGNGIAFPLRWTRQDGKGEDRTDLDTKGKDVKGVHLSYG